jgi:FMN phosphatase YigB (HAD superfamily)
MPKYLHQSLDWGSVQAVGFDLDGTLYDEYEFIAQVYRPIAMKLAQATGGDVEATYTSLLQLWLEKGSSYNRLFEKVLIDACVPAAKRSLLITECLSEFRNFQPQLRLPARVEKILDWMSARYPLFLVTDGGKKLQQAKVDALGLARWISRENISISGCFDESICKPDARMSSSVKVLNDPKMLPCNVIYFGDRDVDTAFAENCGYEFVRVKLMMPIV